MFELFELKPNHDLSRNDLSNDVGRNGSSDSPAGLEQKRLSKNPASREPKWFEPEAQHDLNLHELSRKGLRCLGILPRNGMI